MALGSALVDRARVVRREATGVKREGSTQMSETHGPWFKARLFLNAAPERAEQGGRAKAVATPQLLFQIKDAEGGEVDLKSDDKVEVDSPELGGAVWRVQEVPQPIRKKRLVIGGLVTVERVIEPRRQGVDASPTLPPSDPAWRVVWNDDFSTDKAYVGLDMQPTVVTRDGGGHAALLAGGRDIQMSPGSGGVPTDYGVFWRATIGVRPTQPLGVSGAPGMQLAVYTLKYVSPANPVETLPGTVYLDVATANWFGSAGFTLQIWEYPDFWDTPQNPQLGDPPPTDPEVWFRATQRGSLVIVEHFNADPFTGALPLQVARGRIPGADIPNVWTDWAASDADVLIDRYRIEVPA